MGDPYFSYFLLITVAKGSVWGEKKIDHDITKLVCNIADTALSPKKTAEETLTIIREIVGKEANNSRRTS
jgi:ethanolamine ammonia-lyase large subunit